jgi:hypothetical protein
MKKKSSHAGHDPYELRISRLTIDKLGVKLYDRVSAVVAELVANGYDADAEKVTVRLPLGTLLAKKRGKKIVTSDQVIEVVDSGHGMTPEEAIAFYLKVGRDRRSVPGGGKSRKKNRPVMGRKGIGKLAPFGICQRMEIISAGGEKMKEGYRVAHFFLDYKDLMKDEETAVPIHPGDLDETYKAESGTIVRLSGFLPKRVPDAETFHRQLASRFIFAEPNFEIIVEDTEDPTGNPPRPVQPVDVATVESTRIDLSRHPVETEEGEKLSVKGWLAMAKNPYKNEELAGVRIYARNKIVAMTRDFEQPAGFTGEFTIRSYLVGEIYAEWLDLDEGEDLIRSDRQSILWDSDYGRALRDWGAKLIKEIGGFAAEDELKNDEYLDGMTQFILSIAPHRALIQAFQRFDQEINGGEAHSLDSIMDLFGKARVAEMASYGQIAVERVRVIRELEQIVLSNETEDKLQNLIARAQWLVEPTWSVITKNQALKTFKSAFETFYKDRTGQAIELAIDHKSKKPDFTLVSLGHKLHVVEIKRPKHAFDDEDAKRLTHYIEAFDKFFADHHEIRKEFPDGYDIILVVDSLTGMKEPANRLAIQASSKDGKLDHVTWTDFLMRTKKGHEQFLEIEDKIRERDHSS